MKIGEISYWRYNIHRTITVVDIKATRHLFHRPRIGRLVHAFAIRRISRIKSHSSNPEKSATGHSLASIFNTFREESVEWPPLLLQLQCARSSSVGHSSVQVQRRVKTHDHRASDRAPVLTAFSAARRSFVMSALGGRREIHDSSATTTSISQQCR